MLGAAVGSPGEPWLGGLLPGSGAGMAATGAVGVGFPAGVTELR